MKGAIGIAAIAGTIALAGCASQSSSPDGDGRYSLLGPNARYLTSGRPELGSDGPIPASGPNRRAGYTDLGSEAAGTGGQTSEPILITENGTKVTVNFVNADLQDFVRVVFDDVLKENVIVDPALTGRVTLRTTEPVTRQAALSLVRNVLQLHGAALVKADGVFRVASRGNGSEQGPVGENIRIVPIRFLKAEQARAALQPFATAGTQIVASTEGRYLILAGSPADLDPMAQLLDTLDVDQMLGMFFALVPLKDASAATVATEAAQMFGGENEGAFRVLPIQRMNAVLLMTRSTAALKRAKDWVERLDQTGNDSRQMRVFQIQNRRAADLAKILSGMLAGQGGPAGEAPSGNAGALGANGAAKIEPAALSAAHEPASPETGHPLQGVQVRADTATNSLVVMARPETYGLIESAIRRLDVLPTQVLIEATIAEVGLNDALRYGVRWYFQQGAHGVSLNDGSPNPGANLPGFNYVFNVPQGRLVVNALEKITNLEVISSPALTVLDNETATLKVGDQVPIATRSARSVTNPEAPVVNEIELKDTGIILTVTPRVNASGLVMLDISQEVSDVVPTSTSAIDSPTIRQRKINSSVAVQSGAEIVLGGLISSNRQAGKEGIPGLKDIPILGAVFTSNAVNDRRKSELLVIIRPTVIANRVDLFRITEEIKAGMTGIANIKSR
ncbi:type II secretion system secretin GspD [Microvirga brassicacearum]|uniref:Type II secretion system protein GspD n=1 Tax=Microvirga brassicacearum TaxID=2580413 RepID=A0A5N3P9K9_9HYPH|nr:type II secretion system secretin GspD [Microvirga brassicacearum]KAB0266361.1 type II secretion system protein GspD [Microvirga brassicacearum]